MQIVSYCILFSRKKKEKKKKKKEICPDTDAPTWKTQMQIANAGRWWRRTDIMPFPPFFEWRGA